MSQDYRAWIPLPFHKEAQEYRRDKLSSSRDKTDFKRRKEMLNEVLLADYLAKLEEKGSC